MNRNFLRRPCELLTQNRTMLHMTSTNAEIGIGFTLIFKILTYACFWQILGHSISSLEMSCLLRSSNFILQILEGCAVQNRINRADLNIRIIANTISCSCRPQRNLVQALIYWQVGVLYFPSSYSQLWFVPGWWILVNFWVIYGSLFVMSVILALRLELCNWKLHKENYKFYLWLFSSYWSSTTELQILPYIINKFGQE